MARETAGPQPNPHSSAPGGSRGPSGGDPEPRGPAGLADPAPGPTPGPGAAPDQALEALLAQVARSPATVLLRGESGSGKSRAAHRLHALSGRPGALVQVHLGALTPTLIESELFGHEAGAFTGAHRARAGAFRRANQGTLVLDDVELLPRDAQVKLLRALQERVVEPLGAERPEPIDARFIATTSMRLEEEVAAGRFRSDLYWRLAVVLIEVPPLRARRAEVPLLAQRYLAEVARSRAAQVRALTPAAEQVLMAHSWPGNVRELENALERALALSPPDRPLDSADFEFLSEGLRGNAERLAGQALAQGVELLAFEAALLRLAWAEARGNLSAAARAVGLSRRAFEYRLERLAAEAGAAAPSTAEGANGSPGPAAGEQP